MLGTEFAVEQTSGINVGIRLYNGSLPGTYAALGKNELAVQSKPGNGNGHGHGPEPAASRTR